MQQNPTIAIIERSRAIDARVSAVIEQNLREVLEDSCRIIQLYLDELPAQYQLSCDVALVPVLSLLPQLNAKISCGSEKLLIAGRIFPRAALEQVRQIPSGSRVLVISTTPETAADTRRLLYEMGVHNLFLVAHDEQLISPEDYNIAITPGEASFVPACIPTVVDIGFRKLDTRTFLSVFSRLGIDDEHLSQNLRQYIDELPPLDINLNQRYIGSFLLNKALQTVINRDSRGVIVVDDSFQILLANHQAERILDLHLAHGTALHQIWTPAVSVSLRDPEFSRELIQQNGEPILLTRTTLRAGTQNVGYYFSLSTASSIYQEGNELSKRLKASGLYARYQFSDILYRSAAMADCVSMAKVIAPTDYTVLIIGETGTGKEMVAQSLHNSSIRKNCPFVAINCAALPENLLESELFGYESGAFTGSRRGGKIGLFEQANHGTIFLDEIGDMPLSLQLKILRVLQEKQVMRVGGNTIIDIDVRIIAATNRDLEEAVRQHSFREDLFYRLNGFVIRVPPLRERSGDILYLFDQFRDHDSPPLNEVQLTQLENHSWFGNIRELKNTADYYSLLHELPSTLKNTAPRPKSDIDSMVFECIANVYPQGIGRGKILAYLKKNIPAISQQSVEQAIRRLCLKGLILRSKGRAGCRLTEDGCHHFANEKTALNCF